MKLYIPINKKSNKWFKSLSFNIESATKIEKDLYIIDLKEVFCGSLGADIALHKLSQKAINEFNARLES